MPGRGNFRDKLTRRATRQKLVNPFIGKYSDFLIIRNWLKAVRLFPARGADRESSRNAGWDAVDAAASARKVIAGRVYSVSEQPARDERCYSRTAKPCGPGIRCWCQVERRRSQLNRA